MQDGVRSEHTVRQIEIARAIGERLATQVADAPARGAHDGVQSTSVPVLAGDADSEISISVSLGCIGEPDT